MSYPKKKAEGSKINKSTRFIFPILPPSFTQPNIRCVRPIYFEYKEIEHLRIHGAVAGPVAGRHHQVDGLEGQQDPPRHRHPGRPGGEDAGPLHAASQAAVESGQLRRRIGHPLQEALQVQGFKYDCPFNSITSVMPTYHLSYCPMLWLRYKDFVKRHVLTTNPDVSYVALGLVEELSEIQLVPVTGERIKIILEAGDVLFYVIMMQNLCHDITLDLARIQDTWTSLVHAELGQNIAKLSSRFQYRSLPYDTFVSEMTIQLNKVLQFLTFKTAQSLEIIAEINMLKLECRLKGHSPELIEEQVKRKFHVQ